MAVWNFYHSSSTLQMSIPVLPTIIVTHLSECIREMMDSDPHNRPSISTLYRLSQSYCMLIPLQTLEDLRSMPPYSQWKEIIDKRPPITLELLAGLIRWYEAREENETAVRLLKAAVNLDTDRKYFRKRLAKSYQKLEDWDAAIATYMDLLDQNPFEKRLIDKLTTVCKMQGDGRNTSRVWKELADKHPENTHFAELQAVQYKLNLEHNETLISAVLQGDLDQVRRLLDVGAEINAQDERFNGNALQAAASCGSMELVRFLLDKGADVNAQGGHYGNALQAASFNGDEIVVQLLLDKGANVNAQGGVYGTALQAAISMSKKASVCLLLDKGADVNSRGGHFGNALQAASFNGDETVVRLLLDKGADINAQGGHYGNALQAASYWSNEVIVRWLLEKGANVKAKGGYYGNALQVASYRGNEPIVRLLLDKGANVNAVGGVFNNALHAASAGGNKAIVLLLRESGAHK